MSKTYPLYHELVRFQSLRAEVNDLKALVDSEKPTQMPCWWPERTPDSCLHCNPVQYLVSHAVNADDTDTVCIVFCQRQGAHPDHVVLRTLPPSFSIASAIPRGAAIATGSTSTCTPPTEPPGRTIPTLTCLRMPSLSSSTPSIASSTESLALLPSTGEPSTAPSPSMSTSCMAPRRQRLARLRDFQPGSELKVQDIIDPSLHPLAIGFTPLLSGKLAEGPEADNRPPVIHSWLPAEVHVDASEHFTFLRLKQLRDAIISPSHRPSRGQPRTPTRRLTSCPRRTLSPSQPVLVPPPGVAATPARAPHVSLQAAGTLVAGRGYQTVVVPQRGALVERRASAMIAMTRPSGDSKCPSIISPFRPLLGALHLLLHFHRGLCCFLFVWEARATSKTVVALAANFRVLSNQRRFVVHLTAHQSAFRPDLARREETVGGDFP
ncbi:hypothetical protein BDK51DRAFT_41057 [Blyttiomyces helicus]|uniref:Uncharacterized protein n=1 Tax=Blyttiomyces helicus TaxID=388810 RepID=A0A4P9WEE4_9FUNG|nr:hypothetical protein BDK51DRAFT_41057 [Blyttiomyces helicus]|eukprot:RKO90073.1 hypothetical protein BDK51DRAFT_41057 [Blyttiomyces helicus]